MCSVITDLRRRSQTYDDVRLSQALSVSLAPVPNFKHQLETWYWYRFER